MNYTIDSVFSYDVLSSLLGEQDWYLIANMNIDEEAMKKANTSLGLVESLSDENLQGIKTHKVHDALANLYSRFEITSWEKTERMIKDLTEGLVRPQDTSSQFNDFPKDRVYPGYVDTFASGVFGDKSGITFLKF